MLSFLLIISSLIVSIPAMAHEEKLIDSLKVEFFIEPSDTPTVGENSRLNFEVTDMNGQPITHTDGYVNISKGNTILLSNYYIHSHTGDFSLFYKFNSTGEYVVTSLVQPSSHYTGFEFNPSVVNFDINVVEGLPSNNDNNFVLIGVVLVAVAIGFWGFIWKIKKRKK